MPKAWQQTYKVLIPTLLQVQGAVLLNMNAEMQLH
jgi:hypothetical protein